MPALQGFGLQSRNLREVARRFDGTNMAAAGSAAKQV
jgi:hypothetical protein